MPGVVIENPILNSPYEEPKRHWKFGDDGITDEVVEGRRVSSYFIPIPPPKKKNKQLALETSWTAEREKPNELINQIRQRVAEWRIGGYQGVTATTRALLEYWTDPHRERRLFFCQIEALETAIYLAEVADRYGQAWIGKELRGSNATANPGIDRTAVKMATGSGKTVVMAMLIAWHALNKIAQPQNKEFSDAFLIVTPGITVRDRLRVLLPNDPNNYYLERDIVRPDQLDMLQQAKIVITNYHAFGLRDRAEFAATSLTKKVLAGPDGDISRFKETPAEMVRRVLRDLGIKKSLIVINDEAHHCYREKPESEEEQLAADERVEASQNREAARVWLTGLEAVGNKLDIRACYDLSATPFFLRGSGYREGTLFPWVISDFSLIDAIECGIVKIPRVPVSDNRVVGAMPTYRDLWLQVRDDLPKRSAKSLQEGAEPHLPAKLEGALRSLYEHYEKAYRLWATRGIGTPPVFIVVCSNTAVSKLVYDYVAGWEKALPNGGTVVVPGQLPIFSNEADGLWGTRPNSLLIDSAQIDSGAGMDESFRRAAKNEIEEFKNEYRRRFPDRSADEITNEDLLREVLNTIGKPDRLGESIKCVVSVSMLTEGWDANTVTHILGVRAFGTQLLCEQVVGRGLRRMSYDVGTDGMFSPEYADVYGVPFSFIPTAGSTVAPALPKQLYRVRALPERTSLTIEYPRVVGYRYELPPERVMARFSDDSLLTLTTDMLPTETRLDPIVGESNVTNLDGLKAMRLQHIAFVVARRVLATHFGDAIGTDKPWLFPQMLEIAKRWMRECLVCRDDTFPQLLALQELTLAASERIYRAVVAGAAGEKRLLPLLRPYETIGSTANVGFDTSKSVYTTKNSPLNYVVLDSDWEAKVAEALESMGEVVSYVKNDDRVGFRIPYTDGGAPHDYIPDFLIRWRAADGNEVMVIAEVTGERKKAKAAKIETAEQLWVPAINNLGQFGRWRFVEITDPNDSKRLLRTKLASLREAVVS
ncbi:MAG TPA: DEAD/DEAH box helicase family protein [Candidatus Binatia bacterium]|nr:DEAD/DEAH box helicase family protein [Candidatus Binatia bacterium]